MVAALKEVGVILAGVVLIGGPVAIWYVGVL